MKLYRIEVETRFRRKLTVECDSIKEAKLITLGYKDTDREKTWEDVLFEGNGDSIVGMEEVVQEVRTIPLKEIEEVDIGM